jgi:hypothetical protein
MKKWKFPTLMMGTVKSMNVKEKVEQQTLQ